MSKKDEEIIISKRLATELIWWLEHASAPCMTIGEVHEHWHLFKDDQMTLARDSMKDELEKALAAKKRWIGILSDRVGTARRKINEAK